jgi:hypothetical protein
VIVFPQTVFIVLVMLRVLISMISISISKKNQTNNKKPGFIGRALY